MTHADAVILLDECRRHPVPNAPMIAALEAYFRLVQMPRTHADFTHEVDV